jgi:DUF3073 family protein
MGRRGKQRAKQAKAAREIKYHTMDTDFNELERELGGGARDYDDEAGDRDDRSRVPSDERDAS